jgi:hypothetical protein
VQSVLFWPIFGKMLSAEKTPMTALAAKTSFKPYKNDCVVGLRVRLHSPCLVKGTKMQFVLKVTFSNYFNLGTLTEEEGSVQLTSMYQLV